MERISRKFMYFGTRDFMQPIPCPAIGGDRSGVGYSTKSQYLDGGAFTRRSMTTHREAQMSWTMVGRKALQPLFDYASGVYGPGPFYYLDPFAADINILNPWWASPAMALDDAPVLVGDVRPQLVTNADFSQKYPARGALYTVNPSMSRQKFYVPIAPGTTFHFGAHGYADGTANVTVTPFVKRVAGTPIIAPLLPVSTTEALNVSVASSDGYDGVEISIGGSGSIALFGLMGKVLPNSAVRRRSLKNLVPIPGFEVAGAAVETRRNIYTRPRFVLGDLSPTNGTVAMVSGDTPAPVELTEFWRQTAAAAGAVLGADSSPSFAVVAAGPTIFSTWVRSSRTTTVQMVFIHTAASGATSPVQPIITLPAGVWTRVWSSATIVTPGALGFRLRMDASGAAGTQVGDTFDIVAPLLESGTLLRDFFDGGSTSAGDFAYIWAGAGNSTVSLQRGVFVSNVTPTSNAPVIRSAEWSKSGAYSMRIIPNNASSSTFASPGGDTGGLRLGMEGGKFYTLVVTVHLAAPQTGGVNTASRGIRVHHKVGTGNYTDLTGPQAPNAAGDYELRFTFAIPVGATEAFIRLWNGASLGGGDVWWDNMLVTEVPSLDEPYTGPFFSGDTPNTDTESYTWDGAPNASTTTFTRLLFDSLDNPLRGPWVGGLGQGGSDFNPYPTNQGYSAALDLVGSSATLVETEGWD